ncbi:hypothetical protein QAD02_015219 [Eretmocerus hayati]|uniref:Uncharacterized protein n=1 Tax=Eretmocerus hayati TaxID=131215 RepID=A0ACC2P831_9HYME|nr:hypothetical protein QAD02_015219 [Eretmocerus hayati]
MTAKELTFKSFEEQQCTIKSKSLEKLGIPLPPKRPSPIFGKFMSMMIPTIKQQQPSLSCVDTTRAVVQEWQRYDPEKKRALREQYLAEMEDYLKKKAEYSASLTPEQRQLMQEFVEKEKSSKKEVEINKKKKSLGKPKAAPSPYILFLLEFKNDWMRDKKWNEFAGEVSRRWSALSEQEKSKYIAQSQEASKKYKSDLIVWEGMMMRQGHTDIVRKQVLIDTQSTNKKTKGKK